MKSFLKNPDAELDYYWNWTNWLVENDTIEDAIFTSEENGVTVDSFEIIGGKVLANISGGTDKTKCVVTCSIITLDGRKDSRSVVFYVGIR